MSSLALTVLTLTLGMFFILIGQFKVTSKIFPDVHDDMVRIKSIEIRTILFIFI
jgi:hypothetical protein